MTTSYSDYIITFSMLILINIKIGIAINLTWSINRKFLKFNQKMLKKNWKTN